MSRNKPGRRPHRFFLLLALALSACGDGGLRSPDLPFPKLQGFTVSCTPAGPLPAGASSQCSISDCVFREVLGDGSVRDVTAACPAASWSSSPGSVATIDGNGLLTAVGSGTATVTGSVDGVSGTTPVTVYVPHLVAAAIVCTPNAINAGQTSQCQVNNCSFEIPDGAGGTETVPGSCPAANWSTTPAAVGTINGNGLFSGVGAGTATVTGHVGTLSPTATIQVAAACITDNGLQLTPATATVIAGQPQTYVALARFSNNSVGNVTATTTFGSSGSAASFPPGAGNATASTDAQLATATTLTITGTVSANTCSGNPVSGTAMLTVQPAQLIADGLCLEPADSGSGSFEGCRADSGACAATPLTLSVDQQRQLRLRGRFDNGQECNLTNAAGSSFTSSTPAVASVTDAVPPGRGLVTGLSPGTTHINASATVGGTLADANPLPVTVRLDEMLGSNSLVVSAKNTALSTTPSKFACVGANDLVAGLADSSQLQGQQKLFAGARFCEPDQIDPATGACREFIDDPALPPRDVTNDDGVVSPTNPVANRIAWTQASGFWNGAACATALPTEAPSNPSALVGDQLTPAARYAIGDRRPGENGVVVATGNLRLGFSCITADYQNPVFAGNHDLDGMTVLVLPVTNDVLLGSSTAAEATELCDALAPLFQLGASQNGGDGAVTQLLSVVTELVNPLLQALASGQEPGGGGPIPVDQLVTQVLTGISDPITRQLFTAGLGDLVAAIDQGVYSPLTCGIGALLTALTTADPDAILDAQACLPSEPTFPSPAP